MKIIAIIPARYGSTRFPGKPLEMIGNQSMIQRVYNQAVACQHVHHALVATDDHRIIEHVVKFGGEAVLTSPDHVSGTDRCLEAYLKVKSNHEIVLNIQGDEPFLDPKAISELISLFSDPSCEIGTLIREIKTQNELFNPSCVKAVVDKNNNAMYFSRNPSPFVRDAENKDWLSRHTFYAHIGMYGFRIKTLKQVCSLGPSSLEKAESLEQLRWLQNGLTIRTGITNYISTGIDTPEDLQKARATLKNC